MNFITFPVSGTNIFPIANSTNGGQLVTEYNLRSRESVSTPPEVKYMIGPSFTHSSSDFILSKYTDDGNNLINSHSVKISEGRAVINGHFVETYVPMVIDLQEANALAVSENLTPITGKLYVGLKAMYSNTNTLAGSILVENTDNMYEGIQTVILPESQFILPEDSPDDESKVTAHLLLGIISYSNSVVTILEDGSNLVTKYQHIPASRISDVDTILDQSYITKTGLDPNKLYVFAGKSGDGTTTNNNSWCDARDSLMVWDDNVEATYEEPEYSEARFVALQNHVFLVVPHKQVDGMVDQSGTPMYYADKQYLLPEASYESGTCGIVTPQYTSRIKEVEKKYYTLFTMPGGKQRAAIDTLKSEDELPSLASNPTWNIGDYVLVQNDETISGDTTMTTMWVITAGKVTSVADVLTTGGTPQQFLSPEDAQRQYFYIIGQPAGGVSCLDIIEGSTSDFIEMWQEVADAVREGTYYGRSQNDYFLYKFTSYGTSSYYLFPVAGVEEPKKYKQFLITGKTPIAGLDTVGGFFNVDNADPKAQDGGYVYLDDGGHLRLLDYALLRSGTLAYQLGDDYSISGTLDAEAQQAEITEYINYRVAFKDTNSEFDVIHITLNVPEHDMGMVRYNFAGIDSRFGTCVYLHLRGNVTYETEINISNCQKLRIDSVVDAEGTTLDECGVFINITDSELYYDREVINAINSANNMKIWYRRFSDTDPLLVVDGMTIRALDSTLEVDSVDYWSESVDGDNHLKVALASLTLDSELHVNGCEVLVKNDSTANTDTTSYIVTAEYTLPQSDNLPYPEKKMDRMHVDGYFITGTPAVLPATPYYTLMKTHFTLVTNTWDAATASMRPGTLAYYTEVNQIINFTGAVDITSNIDGWMCTTYHTFHGDKFIG